MALKYVEDVAGYFRKITDESDTTFMSDADMQQFLEIGENEFIQHVSDIDPNFYLVSQNYTLSNVNQYSLANVDPIMGSLAVPPLQRQVSQIIRIVQLDDSGNVSHVFNPVYSYEALVSPGGGCPAKYMLQNTDLKFSGYVTATIRVEFIPLSNVDWTKTDSGDNEYISELIAFHDLIALFAAKSYFMIDDANNSSTMRQIKVRLGHLQDFTERGRLRNANRYVGDEDMWLVNG